MVFRRLWTVSVSHKSVFSHVPTFCIQYACLFAVPTFVGFLRDIESAYEVKEYVRVYLGDTKQSQEFAKQFLEKRSKWRSAQRPQAQADDLCKPAPAVNPNAPAEFQEVKV